MSHELQVLLAFFMGVFGTLYYDFLKCNWEAKSKKKQRKYPTVTPNQRN
jgi:hypothetical protein